MKVVVVYKPVSEHATRVEEFLRDFSKQTGRLIETVDPETQTGIGFCEAYDIVEYPSMIALDDSGKLLNFWKGLPLPTISEVSYYA